MRIIHVDDFDEMAWREALAASPTLRALHDDGAARHGAYTDLLADVFQVLYQPMPTWQPPGHPTLHEFLLKEITDTQEVRHLQPMTTCDAINATLGVGIVGRRLLDRLGSDLGDRLADDDDRERQLDEAQAALDGVAELAAAAAAGSGQLDLSAQQQLAEEVAAAAREAVTTAEPIESYDQQLGALRRSVRQAAAEATGLIERITLAEQALAPGAQATLEDKLRLAQRLEHSSKFQQLVEMAGRVRRIALAKRASIIREAKEEVVGVVPGDDLARAVPAELALLGSPLTRPLLLKKLVERQVVTYEQQGEEKLGGGPIVVCLDGTGSMAGAKEVWSKAVTLAYMAIAEREHRDLHVCQFGGRGEMVTFSFHYRTAPMAIGCGEALRVVETFLDAGHTDLEGPLQWASSVIAGAGPVTGGHLREADVVMITDAEATFTEGFLAAWNRDQERLGFRTFGVLIGTQAAAAVLAQAIEHVAHLSDLTGADQALDTLFS